MKSSHSETLQPVEYLFFLLRFALDFPSDIFLFGNSDSSCIRHDRVSANPVRSSMSTTVSRQDPRFKTLRKSHNLRFPATEADSVASIEICQSPDDVAEALQKTVRAGLRPTIRSGGHCYEDFVCNNPGGVLLDVSLLNDMNAAGSGYTYKIG